MISGFSHPSDRIQNAVSRDQFPRRAIAASTTRRPSSTPANFSGARAATTSRSRFNAPGRSSPEHVMLQRAPADRRSPALEPRPNRGQLDFLKHARAPSSNSAGSYAASTSATGFSSAFRCERRISCLTTSNWLGCIENSVSPMPSSRRVDARIARHFAAHRHRHARALRLAQREGDQMQHRRMQRVVQMRDRVIGTIDRQRVLDQVVRADRQEIEPLQKQPQRQSPPPESRSSRQPARSDRRRAGVVKLALGLAESGRASGRFPARARASESGFSPCRTPTPAGSRAIASGTSAARTGSSGSPASPSAGFGAVS